MGEIIQAKQRHKFVTFWLKFSIFANIVNIVYSIVVYQKLSNLGYFGIQLITQGIDIKPFSDAIHPHILILQAVAAIAGIIMIVSYSKLLNWKKSGFWIIVITAIATAIINIVMMNFIKQDYALVYMTYNYNPVTQYISTPISILILWAILQIKHDGVRCWKNLE